MKLRPIVAQEKGVLSMLKLFASALVVLVFSVGTALAVPVNLLQNGSFEQGPGGVGNANGNAYGVNWDIWGSLPGWADTSGNGIEAQTVGAIGFAPQNGNVFLELDTTQNSGIAQTVTLGVGRYLLSFWYSPRVPDGQGTNGISYTFGSLLSDSITGPGGVDDTSIGQWTQVWHELVVTTAGAYTLSFGAIGTGEGLGGFMDNASLAAIPLPAGGVLLLGAILWLAALRRRGLAT